MSEDIGLRTAGGSSAAQSIVLRVGAGGADGTHEALHVRARFAASRQWTRWMSVRGAARGAELEVQLDEGRLELIDLVEVRGRDSDPARISVEIFDGVQVRALAPESRWVEDLPLQFELPVDEDLYCCTQEDSDVWCGDHGATSVPPSCPMDYLLVSCPEPFTDLCDCAGSINLPACANPD